jgi:hypothetical protein
LPPSFGKAQHVGERLFVLEHVAVFKGNFPAREGLPGRSGVGSKILAEDNDGFRHRALPIETENCCYSKNRRAAAKLQVNRALCYVRKNFLPDA